MSQKQSAALCIPQCTEPECGYMCRHCVQCTCYDYIQGHLCKHISTALEPRLAEEAPLGGQEQVDGDDGDDFLNAG